MILNSVQLTPSGRPVLQPGEVEVILLDKVDLEFHPVGGLQGQQAEAYKHGYAVLTNRRLIWMDAGTGAAQGGAASAGGSPSASARAAALPLAAVAACSKKVQYGLKGAKVRVMVEVYADPQLHPVPVSGFHTNIELVGLRCRGPAPDIFTAQLQEQVKQAVAADATTASTAATAGGGTPPRAAGVPAGASGAGSGTASDAYASPLRAGLQARASPRPSEDAAGRGPGSAGTGWAGSGGRPPADQAAVKPDMAMLQSMVEMGFPRNRSARALMATRNQGVQEAIDFLLAFGEQPGMDDPWDTPTATTTNTLPMPTTIATTSHAEPTGGRYPAIATMGAGANPYAYAPPPAGPNPYPYGPPYSGAVSGPQGSPLIPSGYTSGGVQEGIQQQHSYQQLQQQQLHPHQHPYSSEPDLRTTEAAVAAARAIGVAGIVKREQQKTAESGRAVEEAFRDLSALMSSAATMVALAEKFRGVLGADGSPGGGSGGGEDPLLMDAETQQQLIALGISSPVTREIAGARYHIELSRQLADFLDVPLQRVGGLMSMPDVYCLFNRARGTELVSPDDLLQAAKLFGRAGVSALRLRPLSSGVLVIQGPQHSEERVCAKIVELTKPSPPPLAQAPAPDAKLAPPALGPGLTAGDVALALGGISVAIAAEHLLTAEARGVVCRDDGPEGLRFYRNFFNQDWGLLHAGVRAG